jgi:hypothetical protein
MKLILSKDRNVIWPVTITRAQDGGGLESALVNVTYALPDASEVNQITIDGRVANGDSDTPLLCRVVKNIDGLGIEDSDGNILSYTADLLPAICQQVDIRTALVTGFFECVSGAVEKNV